MVAAYSYMALVPIIQPPVIKLITTKRERQIRMPYNPSAVSGTTRVLFPIFVTIVAGTIAPKSAELIGFLMFGNLIRECGVLGSLSDTAQKTLANLVTLLLGISVAFKMKRGAFRYRGNACYNRAGSCCASYLILRAAYCSPSSLICSLKTRST